MSSKNQTEETQKAATGKNSNGQPANVPPTVVPNSSKNKENKMANKKHQHTQDGKTSQDGKKKRGNSPKRRPMNFGPHNEDTLYPSNASKISPKIENRNFHDDQNGGNGQFSSNNKNTTSPYPVYYNGTVVRNGPNCPQQLMSQNTMFGRLPDQRPRYHHHHHQGFLNTNHGNNKHYNASNNQMFVPQGFSNFNGGGSYTRSPPAGGYQHQRNFEWNNRSLEEFNNANNNRKKRYNFQRKQMNGASTENLVQIKTTTNFLLGTSPRITESPPTSPSRLTPPSPVGYDSDRSSCRSHRSLSEERSSPSLHLLSQSSSSTSSSSCMLMEPTSPSMLKNTRSDSQLHVSSYPYHHATGGYNNGGWSSHVGGGGGGGGSGSSHQYNQGSGYPSRSTFDTTSIGILLDKDGAMDGNAIGYYPKTPTYDMQQQQMKARDRNANSKGVLTSNKSQNSLLDDSNYMKSYSYVVRFHQVPQSLAQQQQPQNDTKPQQILADKFLARSHLLTMRNPPQSLLSHTVWDGVSQSIWNKFYSAQQSVDMYTKKIKLWKQLYSALKEMDQRYELFVVGSTISGFGTDLSDIDMCVVQNNKTTSTRQEESTKLQEIKAHLKSLPDFEGSCVIEARVPILRFKHSKTGVEIDMNFNNPIGIRNTHLLYSYCQMDWRLRPLVLLVKAWAQHNNINDARHSSLSSYSLVLMVIHYLQCGVSPPILPCLHDKYPHKFQDSTDVTAIDMNEELPPYHSENRLPLGQLFYGFLAYFSTFDYKYSAVSVREGKVVPRHVCTNEKSDKNEPRQWKLICIQEPFDKTNTAHSVHDTHVFDRILLTFAHSAKLLHDTKDIDKLFQKEPFYHAIQFGTVPAFPELYVQKDTMYLRA